MSSAYDFFPRKVSFDSDNSAEKAILKTSYATNQACLYLLILVSLSKFLLIHLEQQAAILATNTLSVSDKQHFCAWHLHFKTQLTTDA